MVVMVLGAQRFMERDRNSNNLYTYMHIILCVHTCDVEFILLYHQEPIREREHTTLNILKLINVGAHEL